MAAILTLNFRHSRLAAFALFLPTVATRLPFLVHPQAIDVAAVYSVVANVTVLARAGK